MLEVLAMLSSPWGGSPLPVLTGRGPGGGTLSRKGAEAARPLPPYPLPANGAEGNSQTELHRAPDLLVMTLVVVAGIEDVLRAAVLFDVGVDEQMDVRDETARRLAGQRAVQFVDALPTM